MMDKFHDIKNDLLEIARVRAMINAENDPVTKFQLFDHEKKMAAMLELLKTHEDSDSLHTEEISNLDGEEEQ